MATYLPIRALNRSARVRIDGHLVGTTSTTYVDISKGSVRKELASHSSIGQIFAVGPITSSNLDVVVDYGAQVNEGTSASNLTLGITAGELLKRSDGTRVAVASSADSAVTISTADATNPRWDLVVADASTGAVSKVDGTAAASPTLPATPAGKVALAKVVVDANATGIANAKITDLRPRA